MTTVRLYKDIGLDPSFKKTIDFTSKSAQSSWFTSKTYKQLENVNYNKPQNLLKIPNMDYSEAVSYTYCSLIDLDSSDLRTYYFFIESTAVVDSNTIQFQLTLDPIQTFMCEFEIGECMITRQHVDRWNSGDIPARITPTGEGIIADQINLISRPVAVSLNPYAIACIVFTSPKFELENTGAEIDFTNRIFYGVFPVDMENYSTRLPAKFGYNITVGDVTSSSGMLDGYYPSIDDIINGNLQDWLPLTAESQISFSISPICGCKITSGTYGTIICPDNLVGDYPTFSVKMSSAGAVIGRGEIEITSMEVMPLTTNLLAELTDCPVVQVFTAEQMKDNLATISSNILDGYWSLPVKPVDGNIANEQHEPALYMEPYISRSIMTGKGEVILDIPDIVVLSGETDINVKNIFTSSGIINMVSVGDYDPIYPERLPSIGSQNTHICPAIDIISDAWKTYVLTKRDTDRQMVTNESWRQGINNVLFMGYGGALVGSRSASGDRDSPDRRNQLLNTGVLRANAVAIPVAGATALIDAHYAWEAQMLKEKQIQNEPSILLNNGDGIQTLIDGTSNYKVVINRVDETNYNRAYNNFRKYGYLVNVFDKPNVRSRKYFNYILTNGAIITGSLNTDIKRALARIFDSGITIFHGDHTATLEYPDYENIERSLI